MTKPITRNQNVVARVEIMINAVYEKSLIQTDLKQKVDLTKFATLERRVVRLESKVR